jgi:hypothetical protein
MIRTVWLATFCLAVLGAMAVGKMAKAPSASAMDETAVDGGTVGTNLVQAPLGKTDRLQITLVRQEAPSQPTETPADPTAPDVRKVISPAEPKIVSRHWHEPDATNFGVAKSKQAARKGGAARDPRDSQAADRSRPSEPTKRCDHTAVFGGLLRTLNLAPACDS